VITVRRIEPLGGYRLRLTFSDGLVGELEVDPRERGPMFEPLVDPAYFRAVRVSRAAGTIVWPNGLDLAPETLHRRVLAQHRPAATG
jgi:Protein of unknown function (DUF2442)